MLQKKLTSVHLLKVLTNTFNTIFFRRNLYYMASNLTKPTAIPPHAPPANPEWPSKTGNPSGRNRGNAAPHSNSSKGSKK